MAGAIIPITIPKWGLTMTEGTLTKWHVRPGDKVEDGQLLAEIETSKIVNELEAREDGVIRQIVCDEGTNLPVGSLIAVMAPADVDDAQIAQFIAGFATGDGDDDAANADDPANDQAENHQGYAGAAAQEVAAEIAADGTDVAAKNPAPSGQAIQIPAEFAAGPDTDNEAVHATAQARKLAGKLAVDLAKIAGTGRRGRISKADLLAALQLDAAALADGGARQQHAETPPATPLARRLAAQLDVDLAQVAIPAGQSRLRSADIVAAAKRPANAGAPPASTAAATQIALIAREDEAFEDDAMGSMRQIIAQRLTASKMNAPHYRVTIKARMDAMIALRRELNDGNPDQRISINDMLIKAAASALISSPDINIQFDGSTIRRFADAHISVAVALDDGLITPVIRHANRKGLLEISREMADLSQRAQQGKLAPADYEGGSFSISNLGMFGISKFDAIINPPQAAILAVGGIERILEPADGSMEERVSNIVQLTLSADHRVIDGAMAARFLGKLRDLIERPLAMLV